MNPYQAFEYGQPRNRERVNPAVVEMYSQLPISTSYPQVQTVFQQFGSNNKENNFNGNNGTYVNAMSKTPGRERLVMNHPLTSLNGGNPVPPVVSAFISTVVNTVPRMSIVNARVPYMPNEMWSAPAMPYYNQPTFVTMPFNGNLYNHQVPYANHNPMNSVPTVSAVPYLNNSGHNTVNGTNEHRVQQQYCSPIWDKSKTQEMLPAVKNIMDSFANVNISTSSRKTASAPRIVNSTLFESTSKSSEDRRKVDIMLFVNNDHLYEKFMANADDETEKRPYTKKMAESSTAKVSSPKRSKKSKQPMKQQALVTSERRNEDAQESKSSADNYLPYVVKSTVDSVIGDLVDFDDEEIISGNVCPKIRSLVQPKVYARAETVAGMLPMKDIWPRLKSSRSHEGNVESEDDAEEDKQNPERNETAASKKVPAGKICKFYRSTPIDSLRQHLSNRWKFNQRCDCCGETPLHFAIRLNSPELLDILARTEARNNRGETALHLACETNTKDLAARLLDQRADYRATNSRQESCLSICLKKGHLDLAELILAKSKADLSKDDPDNVYLLAAIRRGSSDFAQLFLNFRATVNKPNGAGCVPISLAVALGHRDIIDCLIRHGANLALSHDKNDDSLLHMACRLNQESSVEGLLFAGASVHSTNKSLERPLHLAARFSSTKIAHMLLTFNADIEAEDSWMRTPLYLAILTNNSNMVKYLLSQGASTKTVVAPLIRELKNNSFHMIKLLISHGLNVHQSDQLGQTLFDMATKYGNFDLFNYMSKEATSREL